MATSPQSTPRLYLPFLRYLYATLHDVAETVLRVAIGIALVVHGAGKITNPFGMSEAVEGLGFYPGTFWSPLLSVSELASGILLTIGLLTRPAAFTGLIILLVTVWFHWITLDQGYMGAEKSIIWAAALFFFVVRGANRHSIDARIGRQF